MFIADTPKNIAHPIPTKPTHAHVNSKVSDRYILPQSVEESSLMNESELLDQPNRKKRPQSQCMIKINEPQIPRCSLVPEEKDC